MSLGLLERPYEIVGDRDEWLARRRLAVGASEVAAIMGLSPYKNQTPLHIYMSKVGDPILGDEDDENLAMEIGSALEPKVKELYERKSGRTVARDQLCVTSDLFPQLAATLDGVTTCGRIVEYKTTSKGREVGDDGSDEIPEHWLVQATAQMIVADEDTVDVAVLSLGRGHSFSVHPVPRNEVIARSIMDHVAAFWDRVQSRQPPPVSAPADLRYVPYLMAEGAEIEFSEEAADAWTLYKALGKQIGGLEEQRDVHKLRVHRALGTAAVGLLPDGGKVVRKTIHAKGYSVDPKTYCTLTFKGDK